MQFDIILKKRYYYFYIWILYFFLFLLVYLSIIPVEFYFKDDYSHFFGNDDLKEITISAARPVYYLFLKAIDSFIQFSLSRTILLRLIAVALLSGLATNLFYWFRKIKHTPYFAFSLSLLICLLPGFRVFIFWLATAPLIVSVWLASLSSFLFFQSWFTKSSNRFFNTIVSSLCLITALSIHQSTAMFIWPLLFILIFSADSKQNEAVFLIRHVLFFGFSMVIYYATYLFVSYASDIAIQARGTFSKIDTDLIRWFIRYPVNDSLDFWHIPHKTNTINYILLTIIIGIFIDIKNQVKAGYQAVISRSIRWCYFLIVIPLSYLPNLLVDDHWRCYRTITPLSTLLLFVFLYSSIQIINLLQARFSTLLKLNLKTILLTSLNVIFMATAHYSVTNYVVLPAKIELQTVKSKIRKITSKKYREIHYIAPYWKTRVSAIKPVGEFGMLSSHMGNVPYGIIRYSLVTLGLDDSYIITRSFSDNPKTQHKDDTFVIDMRDIANYIKLH